MPSIAENLARVQDSIAAACRRAGRRREEIELMAVSKTHPVAYLIEAARAGQIVFGENRVQEFSGKTVELASSGYSVALNRLDPPAPDASQLSASPLQVHLIGHLQSNKSARAAEVFTAIDTLDSLRLAERLTESAARLGRTMPVLLEIKLSPEAAKEGLAPGSDELALLLERLPDLTSLTVRGLMTIAPFDGNPEVARACFRELRRLRDKLAQRHPRLTLSMLSMGMSGDFDDAIAEGSTQVRIGTAIFGARPRPASEAV